MERLEKWQHIAAAKIKIQNWNEVFLELSMQLLEITSASFTEPWPSGEYHSRVYSGGLENFTTYATPQDNKYVLDSWTYYTF